MAPFQSATGCAEVTLETQLTNNTNPYNQVWAFFSGDDWTAARVQLLATEVYTSFAAGLPDYLSTELTIVSATARDVENEFGASFTYQPGSPDVGNETATLTPPSCAAVIAFGTGGGPPRQGRTFHPNVFESVVNNRGILDSTWATGLDSAYQGMFETIEADVTSCQHVVISRFQRKVPGPGSEPRLIAVNAPVISYITRSRVGSQRDRRSDA